MANVARRTRSRKQSVLQQQQQEQMPACNDLPDIDLDELGIAPIQWGFGDREHNQKRARKGLIMFACFLL